MATLDQHMLDCIRFLGAPYKEVHEWLDAYSGVLGPQHRRVRHHRDGIAHARSVFGEEAAKAAAVHILRDCRNIPNSFADYVSGRTDALGLPRSWPVSAYIKYSEREFEELVMSELTGPTGVLLWAFAEEAAIPLIASISRFAPDEIMPKTEAWSQAVQARHSLAPLEVRERTHPISNDEVAAYVSELKATPLFSQLMQQHRNAVFANIELDELIAPLVYIDSEYIQELKAELQGLDEREVARFSVPMAITSNVKAALDPMASAVSFISDQKTIAVSPPQIRQTSEGLEVRFMVTNSFSAIVVSRFRNRYYLRNGIHRAYLLRSQGIGSAPCLLIEEDAPPPVVVRAYPTFSAKVLALDRPPLMQDYFDERLTIEVPLRRTIKLIKLAPNETIIPVD